MFDAFFVMCKSIPNLVLDIRTPSNTFILSSITKNGVELYKSGRKVSNVYTIDPDGSGAFNVYCNQATAGGV